MPSTKKAGATGAKSAIARNGRGDAGRTLAAEPSRVGKRGTVVIPAALRRRYGIEEGAFVVAEPCEGGVLIRPALVLPLEVYTPERKAQFLLSNAINAADYAGAVAEVRRMGLDPEMIPHYKPPACDAWTGSSWTPTSCFPLRGDRAQRPAALAAGWCRAPIVVPCR